MIAWIFRVLTGRAHRLPDDTVYRKAVEDKRRRRALHTTLSVLALIASYTTTQAIDAHIHEIGAVVVTAPQGVA